MPQRAPQRQSAPAETIESLTGGYNGFTAPNLTKPQMWAAASNCFSGQFGLIQRCRFANIKSASPLSGQAFKSLKLYAIPAVGDFVLADLNGKLYSYDTGASYTQTQRLNPYIDPSGTGTASLNGPWSREILQNIAYEMNGIVKQSGRGANAATIESFGLDAPDVSPQINLNSNSSTAITAIARSAGTVTVTTGVAFSPLNGNGAMINIQNVTDTSYNGTFILLTGSGTTSLTYAQQGLNGSSSGGTINDQITKSVGRSYAYAWENANKNHVSAPSPSTQFIKYTAQNASIVLTEPGVINKTGGSTIVTGVGTSFTAAWVGRSLWQSGINNNMGRILSVQSTTQLTLDSSSLGVSLVSVQYQIFDPSATHLRLYATADGGATYFRIQRNAFNPNVGLVASGLTFFDTANAEPPGFPYTTETSQLNNLPPPIAPFINEYQGRILVYGIAGANQTFFYSNIESTSIGLPQESFAPLNQVTLPIANGSINGMLEFPGSLIIWSDRQDMFRLTGLLADNVVTTTSTPNTSIQQGSVVTRLPYLIGCASPFAADITPLGGIWLTSNAEIMLYTDRYAPRNIGLPVQDILNTISPANLNLTRTKYFHANKRNWLVMSVAANGSSFCNTLLVCDLDLLSSNGSPSYFTFDMATNSPSWYVFQVGPVAGGFINPRSDSIEVVYETGGRVRLLVGGVDLLQDADYRPGSFGSEITVPNALVKLHAWGNDSAFLIKRPAFIRFDTASDPSLLAALGWSFAVEGIDDDFYTFGSPLVLNLIPGKNDTSSLCGNPNLSGGESFRHSPCLYRIGGVNFVAGRRLRFQANFPSLAGDDYQLQSVQLGFGPSPPR